MKTFREFSIKQNIIYAMMAVLVSVILLSSIAYYFIFNSSMNDIVESSSKEINKQIIFNYENYINDVLNTARQIQLETVEYDLSTSEDELQDIYNKSVRVNENTVSIVLLGLDGDMLLSSNNAAVQNSYIEEKDWHINALLDYSIFYFSSPHTQDVFRDSTTEVISVSKVISYFSDGVKKNAVLLIDISTEKIVNLTDHTNLGEGGHILILNDDDSLIYTSEPTCYIDGCGSITIAKEIIIGGSYVNVDGIKMYASVNTLNATRWRIATFSNVEILNSSRRNMFLVLSLIMIATVSVVFYLANAITKRITSPLNKLNKHMLEIQEYGELYSPLEVEGQKEIIILSKAFNNMIAEIRRLMERLLREQKEKRKTEFIALQTQINPHFLYNTLDSIIWLSEKNLNDQVIEMIVALSKYFRISISQGKTIITAEEELEHARNYLLIQKIRYSSKFDYSFIVDDEILQVKAVKLILQPIIENAIYHGISSDEDGIITIKAYQNDGLMVFEVENNGYGLTEKQIEDIYTNIKSKTKNTSVGLKNVYQRLKLYYGDDANLEIISELDEKTIVKLTYPLKAQVK